MSNDHPNADTDAAKERSWDEWMMVAVGLTGLLSVLAIIVSVVALSSSSNTTSPSSPTIATRAAAVAPAPAPEAVKMVVKTDDEHGKLGPDGKWHDAFLGGDFTARAGATVKVTVLNYDTSPHSFNAPSLNVDQTIPAAKSDTVPSKVTFTFKAPSSAGSYQWFCALPCDPWAMAHDGYMRGSVKVTA